MHWQFGEMEFGEMKRNTSNWSNFGMLLRRAGLTASAGLSCCPSYAAYSGTVSCRIARFQQLVYYIGADSIDSAYSAISVTHKEDQDGCG